MRPTAGHPVVVAHLPDPPDYNGPHILFYGHYDVQPVDPVELWHSPPFDPQLVDGPRASASSRAARWTTKASGDVPGGDARLDSRRRRHPGAITVLIEGEEEIGSLNLDPFLRANKAELVADWR